MPRGEFLLGAKIKGVEMMLLALIKDLFEATPDLLRKAGCFTGRCDGGSVTIDREAEEQAYQEEKREHSGG
jgi:hypothetical protein